MSKKSSRALPGAGPVQKKKGGFLRHIYQRYLIDAMGAMAQGLFGSLIIGVILQQIARVPWLVFLKPYADMASSPLVVGAAIGVAVAHGLKVRPLAMFASAVCGAVGYQAGGPVGCYLAAVFGAEAGQLISGKTKLDIVLVPMVTIVVGGLVGTYTGPGIMRMMAALQQFISWATILQPIPMGILVSVVMGIILTAPISSAAVCAAIFTPPAGQAMDAGLLLAAGAATAGCCAHMVGFAVASFRENKWGGVLSQGLGTSMLQVGNILKRPAILLPAVVASAITGPLATTLFQMANAGAAAGMGTSGLVGQFGTWSAMAATNSPLLLMGKILILHLALPAVIALGVSEWLRKREIIHFGDMRLDL